jgi:hypothetical protein
MSSFKLIAEKILGNANLSWLVHCASYYDQLLSLSTKIASPLPNDPGHYNL